MTAMRATLTAVCSFTVLATAYLSLSLAVLHPPRANVAQWWPMAVLFAGQAGLTLAALAGALRHAWTRWLLLAGGAAIALVGAAWVRETVSGLHFEGYALVLGFALVLQGALTLVAFARDDPRRHAGRAMVGPSQ